MCGPDPGDRGRDNQVQVQLSVIPGFLLEFESDQIYLDIFENDQQIYPRIFCTCVIGTWNTKLMIFVQHATCSEPGPATELRPILFAICEEARAERSEKSSLNNIHNTSENQNVSCSSCLCRYFRIILFSRLS